MMCTYEGLSQAVLFLSLYTEHSSWKNHMSVLTFLHEDRPVRSQHELTRAKRGCFFSSSRDALLNPAAARVVTLGGGQTFLPVFPVAISRQKDLS